MLQNCFTYGGLDGVSHYRVQDWLCSAYPLQLQRCVRPLENNIRVRNQHVPPRGDSVMKILALYQSALFFGVCCLT